MSELKDRVESWLYDFGVDANWTAQLCLEAKHIIKDQQAQIEELEADKQSYIEAAIKRSNLFQEAIERKEELEVREQVLTSALKAVLDDLKSRARWDDEVKVIPLGSSVYINAEQALSSINPTRSENENPKAP